MSKKTEKLVHYTYIIRHINGKYYVGRHSTNNLDDGYMGSGKWVRSIKDKSTLTKHIIAFYDNVEKLKIAEQELIDKYWDDEYCKNYSKSSSGAAHGSDNHMFGKIVSDETKQKLSIAGIGRKLSLESKKKCSVTKIGELNPMYGKRGELNPMFGTIRNHSEETRQKISKGNSGDKHWNYGNTGNCNEETRQKMSTSHMGKILSKEHKENLRLANLGRNPSVETRQKISKGNSGKVRTEETKLNQSIRQKDIGKFRGNSNPKAKLNNILVKEIKTKLLLGILVCILALEYNVTISTIYYIKNGKTWKHVII